VVQVTKRTCAVLVLGMALGAVGASAYVRFIPSSAGETAQPMADDNRPGDAQAPTGGKLATGKKATEKSGRKPNIVFILTDNLGYGEPGCYGGGILRGAPTPRIDRLAAEGLRSLNFNVESQCTPSRSAIMTGRFAIRSGTMRVPPTDGKLYGLTQWEITIAKLLSQLGYATGLFGKWHLGDREGRLPTNQGFDEWYGIPNTTDVTLYPSAPGFDPKVAPVGYIMEGRKGEKSRNLEIYDLKTRRTIDSEITKRTIDFMKRSVKDGKPFYAYVPLTQVHYPTIPHPDFAGKTGNGDWADCLAELDHHVGEIVDAVKDLGIDEDTIIVFTSDNGPEELLPWRGWAGPWSGSYFTAMEGSLRVPFIFRWTGRAAPGRVSNEIVHEVDTFTTFVKLAGGAAPKDRMIDGVDQSDFFLGKSDKSNREGFLCYVNGILYAIKWRNWKAHYIWQEYRFDAPQRLGNDRPRLHNLLVDPRERNNVAETNGWVFHPMGKMVSEFEESLRKEPPVPPGTADPYRPRAQE
jgi:arylsulfatase A-like enzyme